MHDSQENGLNPHFGRRTERTDGGEDGEEDGQTEPISGRAARVLTRFKAIIGHNAENWGSIPKKGKGALLMDKRALLLRVLPYNYKLF